MATIPIVDKIDARRGAAVAVFVMVLLLVLLFVFKYQIADPPPKDIPVELAAPLDVTEIENVVVEARGSGGGSPSDDPVAEKQPQTEQVLTQTESPTKVNTGNANTTNAPNSQNEPVAQNQSTNPFGDGGRDGGQGGGSAGHFGNDSGTGTGGGTGNHTGSGRIRLNNVDISDLHSNTDEKIALKLTVDAQGNVVSAVNMKGSTTTTNQVLINRVISEVKKQVKFSKDPGAPLVMKFYTVKIKAQ